MNIVSTKPHPERPKQGFVKFEDGTEAWTPEIELVKAGPVPSGWTLKDGPYGKQFLPPKPQGQAAWVNTREGAEWKEARYREMKVAESESIRAHQLYEQERMDRRTALMQAVAFSTAPVIMGTKPRIIEGHTAEAIRYAEEFYNWLRESAGTVQTPQNRSGATESDVRATSGVGDREGGTGALAAPTEPEGGGGHGEGAAAPLGFHQTGKAGGYPLEPDLCDHKAAAGWWLPTRQVEGQPVCPRCGLPTVLYRESGP